MMGKVKHTLYLVTGLCVALIASTSTAQERLKMSVMAPGTSSYQFMTTFATNANSTVPNLQILIDAQGVQTKHMLDLARGKTDIAMTSPTAMDHLANGTGMFQQTANAPDLARKLRLLFWFPNGPYHAAVQPDQEAFRVKDLKGQRIFLGPPGSDDFLLMRDWLEASARLSFGVDYEPFNGGWLEAITAFRKGEIDVYYSPGIPPHTHISTLARGRDIRIIGVTSGERSSIEADTSLDANTQVSTLGRRFENIPVGSYGDGVSQREILFGPGGLAGIIVNEDLDADLVYEMVKAFWQNKGQLNSRGEFMRSFSDNNALIDTSVKLHPGAVRYYEEAGWQVPNALK